MNDDKSSEAPVEVPIDDTAPPDPPSEPQKAGEWKMPEPKFQKTSGYLPQGFLEQLDVGNEGQAAQTAPPVVETPETSSIKVEAQPDLSEQIVDVSVSAAPATVVKQRSPAVRITMIVFGLLAMIGFIAVFLAVIYFLFLAPQSSSQF